MAKKVFPVFVCPKFTKKTKQPIDQIFIDGQGWISIRPIPLRRFWWKKNSERYQRLGKVEAVRFVKYGDYRVDEFV